MAPAGPDPTTFRREVFYPLALGGWCVDLDDFRTFSAYNVWRHMVPDGRMGLRPQEWWDVVGGMGAYVAGVMG